MREPAPSPLPPPRRAAGLAVLHAAAFLAACGGDDAGADDPAPGAGPGAEEAAAEAAPAASLEAYLSAVRERAGSRPALREAFGEPDSVRVRPVPNRHFAGQIDTVYGFHYAGALFAVYAVTGGDELFARAEVSANRFLPLQPRIGTPVDSVVAWFGEPDRRTEDRLTYRFGEAESQIMFDLADGTVRRALFFPYLD